jgi:dihydropteroate synthase
MDVCSYIPGMPCGGFPVLVGASRKSFIGHVLKDTDPAGQVHPYYCLPTASIEPS